MPTSCLNQKLARLWRKTMPSLPIRRQVDGVTVFFNLKDQPFYCFAPSKKIQCSEITALPQTPSKIWDVGSNVGIFSLKAAQLGHEVIAFDISSKAIQLLQKAAKTNQFIIQTVENALSVEPYFYTPPNSCHTENKPTSLRKQNQKQSLTYQEAAAQFGHPHLIKMDIEGGELEFLKSSDFRHWLLENHIGWLVELHHKDYLELLSEHWNPQMIDENHYAVNLT
jgi:FkbM family methyltransferase